jgi:hypothetical protein
MQGKLLPEMDLHKHARFKERCPATRQLDKKLMAEPEVAATSPYLIRSWVLDCCGLGSTISPFARGLRRRAGHWLPLEQAIGDVEFAAIPPSTDESAPTHGR